MTELRKKLKELIIKTIIILIIEVVIFSFFFSFQALWVLWGGTGAIIGFISLAEEIKKMDPDSKTKKFSFVFLIRYVLYFAILCVAALNSLLALMLSFFGIMNMKIASYLSYK